MQKMKPVIRLNSIPAVVFIFLLIPSLVHPQTLYVSKKFNSDTGWVLSMKIINDTSSVIETYRSNLPWGLDGNVALTAIPLRNGSKPLRRFPRIDDPRVDPISIEKGQAVTGFLMLNEKFNSLSEENIKNNIVVCYKIKSKILLIMEDQQEGCFILEKVPDLVLNVNGN